MATSKQFEANRRNALKGGVKTDLGKAVSRLNARKHSIFVTALTPEDSEALFVIEDDLIASMRPVGRIEEMLVEKLALTWLRMQRCARAEAEFHMQTWEEPNEDWNENQWEQLQKQRGYGMRAVPFKEKVFERMVKLIDLYDTRLTNQWLKLLHEVERLQRQRKHGGGADEPERQEPSSAAPEPREPASAAQVCSVPVRAYEEAPAPTQTSRPPAEKLKFIPPAPQPPSVGRNYLPASSRSDVPEPETPESSQARNAAECVIPWPGEKTNPIGRNIQ